MKIIGVEPKLGLTFSAYTNAYEQLGEIRNAG